jgi:type IV pilus assembly protein PilO
MKITSMQKMIAAAAGFVILAVLAVVLFVLPMYTQLGDLATQKVAAQQQLQQAQLVLARLQDAKSRSAGTEAQILQIGTEMPDSPQLPTLIMELQDIANADDISVTSFTPAEPVPAAGGKFTEIAMTTQITAKWDDLLDYLTKLNESTRLLRVTNVTVGPAASSTTTQTSTSDPDLTVSLTTKAYVMGTNGVISAASTTASGTAGQ